MKRWEEEGWQQDDLDKLELGFLNEIFQCDNPQGVDATCAYAKFLNMTGVNSDNYPIYFRLLEMKNHWVVDSLIGEKDPETYFSHIQPNYFIIQACFKSFGTVERGGIYPKSLMTYFSLLNVNYKNPLEGYRVYPPTSSDVNHLGKHLDEKQDQMYDLNRSILGILDRIASLVDPGRPEGNNDIVTVATQANNIRGKFLDMTKSLNEAIPEELLTVVDYKATEVAPSS